MPLGSPLERPVWGETPLEGEEEPQRLQGNLFPPSSSSVFPPSLSPSLLPILRVLCKDSHTCTQGTCEHGFAYVCGAGRCVCVCVCMRQQARCGGCVCKVQGDTLYAPGLSSALCAFSCHIQCLLSPRPRTKPLVRLLSPSFEQSQQEAKGRVQADVGSEESQREAWHRGRIPGSRCSCQRTPGSLYPRAPGVEGQTPPRGAEAARGPGEAVWERRRWLQPGGERHHRGGEGAGHPCLHPSQPPARGGS